MEADRIKGQLKAIRELQGSVQSYKGHGLKRLKNKTGKNLEEYKVWNRKLRGDLKKLRAGVSRNCFEELLLECGEDILKRAEACISHVYAKGYLELLKRSMKKSEICVGKYYVKSLNKEEGAAPPSLMDCYYNMVEMDAVYALGKLKRKEPDLPYEELIRYYCSEGGLDENSYNFILALISYPHSSMKVICKYRKNKHAYSPEEFEEKLRRAMRKDGKSLIEVR